MTGTGCRRVRWGIAGTGAMAATMVRTLRSVEGAELVAIGSRNAERASRLARAAGVARGHSSYLALVEDPEVEVVHVATEADQHVEVACAALAAGKHVLVEKPFATHADGARRVVAAARAADRFCMEAMWLRFLPAVDLLLRDVDALDPRLLVASVGFAQARPAPDVLTDLAVYPVSLAHLLLGAPREVLAGAVTDGVATVTLAHEGGAVSHLAASGSVALDNRAVLSGRRGRREMPGLLTPDRVTEVRGRTVSPMSTSVELRHARAHLLSSRPAVRLLEPVVGAVRRARGEVRTRRAPAQGEGYAHEVRAVQRALAEGRLECDWMPLAESVAVLETLDGVRRAAR